MITTPLPTPPSTGSPSNFDSRADNFLGALPLFQQELDQFAAQLNNISTTSTSETELAISTGEKTLTVEADKSYFVGMSVKIANTTDGAEWMLGDVLSYDIVSGELVVDVQTLRGTGTISAWTITLSFSSAVVESGSVASGDYVELADGTVLIKHTPFLLVYLAGTALVKDLTMPVTLIDTNYITMLVGDTGAATLASGKRSGFFDSINTSTSQVQVRLFGDGNFISGDQLGARAFTIGRRY